jgi:hypothetical protein
MRKYSHTDWECPLSYFSKETEIVLLSETKMGRILRFCVFHVEAFFFHQQDILGSKRK